MILGVAGELAELYDEDAAISVDSVGGIGRPAFAISMAEDTEGICASGDF